MGQASPQDDFVVRGLGYTLLLRSDGLALNAKQRGTSFSRDLTMKLLGAQRVKPVGHDRTATQTSYYLGADRSAWRVNIPSYASVAYQDVYKGVDLVYHGDGSQLEYDFVVAPGADPSQVHLSFGADMPRVQGSDLAFAGQSRIRLRALRAFQVIDGEQRAVEAHWQIGSNEVSIRLGQYDTTRPLVIDPVFFYGGYLGGAADDAAVSIVSAGQPGFFYVAMSTDSAVLGEPPPGAASPCSTAPCPTDTLILGINTTNSPGPPSPVPPYTGSGASPTLVVGSATYFGGTTGITVPTAMAADKDSSLYLTGTTNANSFPPLNSQACTPQCGGYVAKFSTSLNASAGQGSVTLQYAFALPASPMAIAVDAGGDAFVTGSATISTGSPMLTIPPSSAAFQAQVAGAIGQTTTPHAFLLTLGPMGTVLFCSYIGGSGSDQGNAVAVSGDTVFVAGQTSSADFPNSAAPYQAAFGGGTDAFVLAASGLTTSPKLAFSNYLGGSGIDTASAIAVAPSGNIVIVGSTASTQFPIQSSPSFATEVWPLVLDQTIFDQTGNQVFSYPDTVPALVPLPTSVPGGSQDAFVTSLTADGKQLLFTDFLGGKLNQVSTTSGDALAVDNVGVLYVTGSTSAAGGGEFLSGNYVGDTLAGDDTQTPTRNIFFGEINPSGRYLLEATLAGGSGLDLPRGIAVGAGVTAIVGSTLASSTVDDNSLLLPPNPDLFRAASASVVYPLNPAATVKSNPASTTGFFVEEALAGYCDMQLVQQVGKTLTFAGPCVAGTDSGTLFVTPSASTLAYLIPVTVVNGTLTGSVTVDLSTLPDGMYNFTFGFRPLGAIGGVGICQNNISSVSGCGIVTSGGGSGTIFNVSTGLLSITLSCAGAQCTISSQPNTALTGSPLTLNAAVINGIPNTVTWSSSQGAFTGTNPAASIVFTPGGAGGPIVVKGTSPADPSISQTLTINTLLPTTVNIATGQHLAYGQTSLTIAVSSGQPAAPSGSIAYQIDGGAGGSGTLALSAGSVSLPLPKLIAGSHVVAVTYGGSSTDFFAASAGTASFTVAKAPVTVTATTPAPITFGQPIPTLSYITTGFVNGETSAVITGTATLATTATSTSPPGAYPITFVNESLSAGNYSFTYVPGTLTIAPIGAAAPPVILPGAGVYTSAQIASLSSSTPASKIYYTTDGSTPTITSALYTGPFAVNATETLRAVATSTGYATSVISSATYTLAAPALSNTTLPFGNITQGTSSGSLSVSITNQGLTSLGGLTVSVDGPDAADFVLGAGTTCHGSLPAGATCSVPLTFVPSGLGTRTASLTFGYAGIGAPQKTTLTGGGLSPLSLTSSAPQLVAGTTFQFTASMPVTWTTTAGTIDASGLFTAPPATTTPVTVTITAISKANAATIVTIDVTIVPAPTLVVPSSTTLPAGGTVSVPLSINAGTGIAGELLGLACTPASLPSGVYCSFTPAQVPNTGASTPTLQIFSTNLASDRRISPFSQGTRIYYGFLLFAGGAAFASRRKKSGAFLPRLFSGLFFFALALSFTACGSGGSFTQKTSTGNAVTGTYTLSLALSGASPSAPDFNQTLTTSSFTVTIK